MGLVVVRQVAVALPGVGNMQCPRCKTTQLSEIPVKGKPTKLDKCPACKGIWFDEGEVTEIIGTTAIKTLEIPNFATQQNAVVCPRCSKPLYMFSYPGTMTLVDGCKQCNGLWLDNDEIKEIHASRKSHQVHLITCPKCGRQQPKSDECIGCGIIMSKYKTTSATGTINKPSTNQKTTQKQSTYADNIPGIKGSLLRFVDRTISNMWFGIRH